MSRSIFSYVVEYLDRLWFFIFDRIFLYPIMGYLVPKFGIQFMNLGYLPTDEEDEREKTMSTLVEATASNTDFNKPHYFLYEKPLSLHPMYPELRQLSILEVGCGHGSGMRWVLRAHPEIDSICGVDRVAVNSKSVSITQGSAELLPHGSERFDIILNVESSHLYADCEQFFRECHRVLKPGGYLCWIDIRYAHEVWHCKLQAKNAGLELCEWVDTTEQVLKGIHETAARYDAQMEEAPFWVRMFRWSIRATYCAPGTHSYNRMDTREKVYSAAIWRKPN